LSIISQWRVSGFIPSAARLQSASPMLYVVFGDLLMIIYRRNPNGVSWQKSDHRRRLDFIVRLQS